MDNLDEDAPRVDANHVVMEEDRFLCKHCGSSYTTNMPVPIPVFVGACNAFVEMHADCKEST